MTLLLLCLGPGGTLVSGGPLEGLDEEEVAVLLAKSAGISYYNPSLLPVTQGGSYIRELCVALSPLPPNGRHLNAFALEICSFHSHFEVWD